MAQEQSKVNVEALRGIYHQDETARIVLDQFASRQRNWSVTTVDRLLAILQSNDHSISRGDVISVFKRLEELGCGAFVVGRRGSCSRFEWRVQMVSAARAAAGETTDVEEVSEDEDVEEESQDLLEHRFRLRTDLVVNIELPADITTREAQRLSEFIQSLPFN